MDKQEKNYKVSFCITCKGRLSHLKKTLPLNLKNNQDYNPHVEFVVLDYGSEDGLENWIKENFQAEVASGTLRYAKMDVKDAPYFKMAHAKNMAHRLATGDIVCNLDADNITSAHFASWLNKKFVKDPNIYIRSGTLHHMTKACLDSNRYVTAHLASKARSLMKISVDERPLILDCDPHNWGISGRIAMMKDRFMALHGYDERYQGWGGDDTNLIWRAERIAGLTPIAIPFDRMGQNLSHSDNRRIELMAPEDKTTSAGTLQRFNELRLRPNLKKLLEGKVDQLNDAEAPLPPANPDGNFGCGSVRVNFQEDVTLAPVAPSALADKSWSPPELQTGFRR